MAAYTIDGTTLNTTGATLVQGTLGSSSAAQGDAMYQSTVDDRWFKLSTSQDPSIVKRIGICCNIAATNQAITLMTKGADINPGITDGSAGDVVTVGGGGALQPDSDLGAGNYVYMMGVLNSTTNLNLAPQYGYQKP